MPLGNLPGLLPPHVMHEAVSLLFEVVKDLHAVTANGRGVLFALAASPHLADRLAAFGAEFEDAEDDGLSEPMAGLTATALEAMLAPAARQGHPVPAWMPPDPTLPVTGIDRCRPSLALSREAA